MKIAVIYCSLRNSVFTLFYKFNISHSIIFVNRLFIFGIMFDKRYLL